MTLRNLCLLKDPVVEQTDYSHEHSCPDKVAAAQADRTADDSYLDKAVVIPVVVLADDSNQGGDLDRAVAVAAEARNKIKNLGQLAVLVAGVQPDATADVVLVVAQMV